MGIPGACYEINNFTLERHGARVFVNVDIDALNLPATATMEVAIRFHAALGEAIAEFRREQGAQIIKLSERGPMFLREYREG